MKNVKFYEKNNKGFALFYNKATETKAEYFVYFSESKGKVSTVDANNKDFKCFLAESSLILITAEQAALKYPDIYAFVVEN